MECDSPDSYTSPSLENHENRRRTQNILSKSSSVKQIYPKVQKSSSNSVTPTLHSNKSKHLRKRKMPSTLDAESDDDSNQIIQAPNGKNGCNESIQKNSKCSTRLTEVDGNSSTRKKFPLNANSNLTAQIGSIDVGEKLLSLLIKPFQIPIFMGKYWEIKPLHIKRNQQEYYKVLISTEQIDKMLRENRVQVTKDIDITNYIDGVRENFGDKGDRARPNWVWQRYREGCSIRIPNPQTFLPAIHSLNATLQEYFKCMIGANVYLTPPNSQDFAPHFDEIEAFVLQIEGRKCWRVYESRDSSKAFNQEEIGEPCLDVVLEAGDLLYFPRGYIHQAVTVEDCRSLHITISINQKKTYRDLIEKIIPIALTKIITEDVSAGRPLPLNIWQRPGVVTSRNFNTEREATIARIRTCMDKICHFIKTDTSIIDNAVDQMSSV